MFSVHTTLEEFLKDVTITAHFWFAFEENRSKKSHGYRDVIVLIFLKMFSIRTETKSRCLQIPPAWSEGYLRIYKTIYAKSQRDFVGMQRAATRMHCAATRLHRALVVPRFKVNRQDTKGKLPFTFYSANFEIQDVRDLWVSGNLFTLSAWWQLKPWMNNIHGSEACWQLEPSQLNLESGFNKFSCIRTVESLQAFWKLTSYQFFSHICT